MSLYVTFIGLLQHQNDLMQQADLGEGCALGACSCTRPRSRPTSAEGRARGTSKVSCQQERGRRGLRRAALRALTQLPEAGPF